MPWMRVDASVRENPKIERAARRLAIAPAHMGGHMLWLWLWALRYAADGDLRGRDNEQVAIMAQWPGDADQFVNALVSCGLLDRDESTGSLRVHDWMEYADQYKEAHKKAKQRAKIEDEGTSPGQSEKVPPRRRRGRKTKTDLPESEEHAHQDATTAPSPEALSDTAPGAPHRPADAPSVADVAPGADDAPQPRREASVAKVAPPPPVLAAVIEPEVEDPPKRPPPTADWGAFDEDLLDPDDAGAREGIAIYNAHRHPSLPEWSIVRGCPLPVGLIVTMKADAQRERAAGGPPERGGAPLEPWPMHRRSGWRAFAEATHRSPKLLEWRWDLGMFFSGANKGACECPGFEKRKRLFDEGYVRTFSERTSPSTTAVRSLVEAAYRMPDGPAEPRGH